MKKRIVSRVAAVALLCFVTASAAACSNETEEFVSKPVTGIDAMFDESLGYYNEHPCVVQVSETERYVYYTKNTARSENGSEYIAVRQGTFQDGTWTYGEPAAALSPAQSGWDSGRVFQADVIGGSFTYEGDSYAWLMAYAGTGTQSSRDGAQIGLAVASSPAGPWTRVGSAPFVTWSASDYTQYGELLTDGVNEPSLVSYNRAEQVILFYSLYNPNTVDSCKYVLLDLSGDLNALTSVKGERGNLLSSKGIRDMSTTPACIAADFALTADGETLIRSGGSGVHGVRRAAIIPTSKRGRSCLTIRMRLPKSLHRRSRRQSRGSWRTASSSTSPSCLQTGTGCSLRRQRRRRRLPSGPVRTTAQRGRCAAA